jgi:hypothetical protein
MCRRMRWLRFQSRIGNAILNPLGYQLVWYHDSFDARVGLWKVRRKAD